MTGIYSETLMLRGPAYLETKTAPPTNDQNQHSARIGDNVSYTQDIMGTLA